MSGRVLKKELQLAVIDRIKEDCFVQGRESDYGPAETLQVYGETAAALYLPFAYCKTRWKQSNKDNYANTMYTFKTGEYPFRGDQEIVFKEALNLLKRESSVLLSLHCGYGKTMLAIRLAQRIGYKTAVLLHRGVLFDQWLESIHKFTTAKVQQVDTTGTLDPSADIYLFNIAYVHKRWQKESKTWVPKKLGRYKNIGLLIVDEAHIAGAPEMSKALLHFNPAKAIALTATPVRKDGLDKVLELYFGEYSKTQLIRISKSPFTVYRLPTKIKPEFSYNAFGKKDWNSVISSLIDNPIRNELIVDLVCKFTEYNILVLTKRCAHCKLLAGQLRKHNVTCTIMTGVDKSYDKKARVLLSTYSKLGVGFDDSRLNMLIIACSVTEVEQYAGRLRDGPNKDRIIIDLVDNDPNCQSHWQERRKWYISRKGTIKNYYSEYSEYSDLQNRRDDQNDEQKPGMPTKRLARRVN
jgi:superfamily II DNA or RNA helicase